MQAFHTYENTQIYYETHGEGPEVIIFLHGFACSHLNWYLMKDHFDPKKYTIYLVDLKGFGNSSKPRDIKYGIKDMAFIMVDLITQLKLQNIILIGHSLGASVALTTKVLIEYPLIKKLILIGVPAYIDYIPRFIKRLRTPLINRLFMLIIYLLPNAIKTALSRIYFNPGRITNEIIGFYTPYYKKPAMAHTYIQVARRAIPDDYEIIKSKYPSIDIPVLLIWGTDDNVVSKRNGFRLVEDIPDCRLEFIKDCGHNTMEECPVETSNLILNFIAENSL
ncbi:MAG: alpha/beta hydrolase [Bacteroidales bacterium]|nr:alpha/beta hydrolase [Bacteroidales bacterium]